MRERERERECKQTESRKTDLNLRKYFLHLSHAQDAQVKLVQIKTSVNNFWLRTVWSELVVCSIFGHLQQSKFTQKYLKIAEERSNLYSNTKLNVKDFAQDKKNYAKVSPNLVTLMKDTCGGIGWTLASYTRKFTL